MYCNTISNSCIENYFEDFLLTVVYVNSVCYLTNDRAILQAHYYCYAVTIMKLSVTQKSTK